jgi:hypothetical protein
VAPGVLPAAAQAHTVNVAVSFTPYPGAPGQAAEVRTVPGRVEVVLNGMPMLDNPLEARKALVMGTGPSGPELSPAFWLPVRGLQPVLRRGPNLLQLRFTPQDGRIHYESQFRWVVVSDRTTTTTTSEGTTLSTNQAAEGGEHRFEAPFAPAEPWHSDPPIQALEPADCTAIHALLARRAAQFSPDFSAADAYLAALPDDVGLCVAVVTGVLSPSQLLLVKGPQGQWRVLH